jgi:hypothetical protein
MPDREITEKNLRAELTEAREQYDAAAKAYRSVNQDIPSGLPHPDGVLRTQEAGTHYRNALQAYMKAVARYKDFIVRCIAPEDL